MDIFQALPTEIRRIVLENLDLPSLYSTTRAYLSLAKTFNAFPADILEAATRHYHRQIQQCIRMVAAIPSDWVAGMSYKLFQFCYIHGPAKNRSFPFAGISAAEAHSVLRRAWRVHWIVRNCLDGMIQRSSKHFGKSVELVKLPVFPSWVEEQRMLRAAWRLQVCIMLEKFADRFQPKKVEFDIHNSKMIWKHIANFEHAEMSVVIDYSRRVLEQPGYTPWQRDWAKVLENDLFDDEMIQPSWNVLNPVESPEDWFAGREESHLRAPGRGFRIFSCQALKKYGSNDEPINGGLPAGRAIWDKDRLRRLGLDSCALICRLDHWHDDEWI